MATLFERVSGVNLGPNDPRIPIHVMRGLVGEAIRGRVTVQNIIDEFSMTAAQITDLNLFVAKFTSHPNALHLSNVIFDFLALAERKILSDFYTVEDNFWQVIDDEIALATGV